MEASEHILKLEKLKMEAELKMKQAVIDAQSAELLKLRDDFSKQSEKITNNEENFQRILSGLNPKVVD